MAGDLPRLTAPAAAGPSEDPRALAVPPILIRWSSTRAAWIFGLDVVLVVLFTVLSTNGVFASMANAQSLLLSGTQALLLGLGLALLLGAGVFDLSLGANLVLSSVAGAMVMRVVAGAPDAAGRFPNLGAGIVLGVLACLLTGTVFGLVNGVLIAYFGINSLIATLGTLGVGSGLALVLTGGSDIAGLPSALQSNFGLRTIAAIPAPALVAVVLAVILGVVVRFTRFGLRTQAIGSSRTAAERVGLRVPLRLLVLVTLVGSLAGLAGLVDLARFGSTAIAGHANDALGAVTAAVIGGTQLEGGRISVLGTVWGAALAVILQGGLVIIGVSSAYQLIAVGAVLILAVGLDRLSAVRRATR
ncbi:MAG: ribose transport system permease protein [Nocardioidaceae bacterium]|jgi:ribose transport system permease protein|nr:ribose transport system permease protein [Nocardioidaceae bacterium]